MIRQVHLWVWRWKQGVKETLIGPGSRYSREPEGGQHTKHPGGDQAWSVRTTAYQSAFGRKDSDLCYDTDEPRHGHYAKQKEPDAKDHVVYGFIYGKYPEQTSADGQKGDWRWPGAGGARPGRGCDRQQVSF